MEEDYEVLDDSAERAEQPGQGAQEVVLVLRVDEEAEAVGRVARQREQEEEQGQACGSQLACRS